MDDVVFFSRVFGKVKGTATPESSPLACAASAASHTRLPVLPLGVYLVPDPSLVAFFELESSVQSGLCLIGDLALQEGQ